MDVKSIFNPIYSTYTYLWIIIYKEARLLDLDELEIRSQGHHSEQLFPIYVYIHEELQLIIFIICM